MIYSKTKCASLVRESANVLGSFVGASGNDIAFTGSTMESLNAVLRSLVFLAGDEVIIDVNTYSTTKNILNFVYGRARARVVRADGQFLYAAEVMLLMRTKVPLLHGQD